MKPSKKKSSKQSRVGLPSMLKWSNAINGHAEPIDDTQRSFMIAKITEHMRAIMDLAGITPDSNSENTPERWSKMFVNEFLKERWAEPPKITTFKNPLNYDQVLVPGPIWFVSTCAHHLMPISGWAWIGVLPSTEGVPGLSKYTRIVEWFSGVPQIQEDLTAQIALFINEVIKPRGVVVRMVAKHGCCTYRGVFQPNSLFTTQYPCGDMLKSPNLLKEFNDIVTHQTQLSGKPNF